MRRRKLTALVCAILIFGGCMLLYLMMDVTLFPHEFRENKWIRIGDRLKELEDDINKHHETVSRTRDSIKHIIHSNPPPPMTSVILQHPVHEGVKRMLFDHACEARFGRAPDTDVQMLDLYGKLTFDNVDGGAWKQGWNIEYDPNQWNEARKLKVFVVPHSHNDPGWIKTFEDYYQSQTRNILNNMVKKLGEDRRRKFIWAEISFFSLWWDEIKADTRTEVRKLIDNGQLEIVTGGWVMNDEANTDYFSMLEQMIEGHNWLTQHLGIKPNNSWSIDPFGYSPVMPYLLKGMGFENLLIQRVHYSVKKHLARNRQLEFRWRQLWDLTGSTDLLTHVMPFYSYDVPHTCGPDPMVCCQFDFRRLPGYGMGCPWKKSPKAINDQNVGQRAQLLLDQYRKKAQLFKTNVVIAPLGDDFRYDQASEWDLQFNNYQKLFDYMNNEENNLHVEAQFGTLQDYFQAVREDTSVQNFPTLTGDFFTYADRDDHYWSGYYTSRPFYKRMDRVLAYYLRAAEILFAFTLGEKRESLNWPHPTHVQKMVNARKSLSLFQHHDGITGTAKDHVVEDYGQKMNGAIADLQHLIQQSAHFLLSTSQVTYQTDPGAIYFDLDDLRKYHYRPPEKTTLTFQVFHGYRKIVIFNSLTWKRQELVTIRLSTSSITVTDNNGTQINCQITPIFHNANMVSSLYDVSFIADIPPLSLVSYFINADPSDSHSHSTYFSKLLLFTQGVTRLNLINYPELQYLEAASEFSLKNKFISAAFSKEGLLKAVTLLSSAVTVPVHLDFVRYGAREGRERSGAYLFLPDGEAETLIGKFSTMWITTGPLFSQVDVSFPNIHHTVRVCNTPGADSFGLEIHNSVDISLDVNFELAMRFSSGIKNGDEFFTDLNGLQVIRRKRLQRLPIQANYYPMPSVAFIQDKDFRLTLLAAQPGGFASLKEGQIEVMQDRRLNQDDNRGLGQGVLDNKPTESVYRLILEKRQPPCQEAQDGHPEGFISATAHIALYTMTNPLMRLLYVYGPTDTLKSNFGTTQETGYDMHLVKLHPFFYPAPPKVGIIFFRPHIDTCFYSPQLQNFSSSEGVVKVSSIFPSHFGETITEASLSFLHLGKSFSKQELLQVCPMELSAYLLTR